MKIGIMGTGMVGQILAARQMEPGREVPNVQFQDGKIRQK